MLGAPLALLLAFLVPAPPAAAAPAELSVGLSQPLPGALVYRPRRPSACGQAYPLLVLLPGTGGSARGMIDAVRPVADRHGIILFAAESAGENWDAVDAFFDDYERGSAAGRTEWAVPQFGNDARRLRFLTDRLLAYPGIDRRRVGLLGFSHGASYALTFGAAHPDLFGTIIALSPGILVLPPEPRGGQRVFLSHGREDPVQPFRRTQEQFLPRLNALGFATRFRPYRGGHELPPLITHEAGRFFLEAAPCGA